MLAENLKALRKAKGLSQEELDQFMATVAKLKQNLM